MDGKDLNLATLAKQYSDEHAAWQLVESIRWPDGPICPHCGHSDKHYYLGNRKTRSGKVSPRRVWKCASCRKQFSALHSMVYAAEPWAVIQDVLPDRCTSGDLPSAISFVRQAQEYFQAAERAGNIETRPVLYYYSFLNLVKALGLANRVSAMVGSPKHGMRHNYQANETIQDARLVLLASQATSISVFDTFHQVLTGSELGADQGVGVSELMAQSVIGHRLWREASNRKERFVGVENISLLQSPDTSEVWATIEVRKDSLLKRSRTLEEVLREGNLSTNWQKVGGRGSPVGPLRRFEQTHPIVFTQRASDHVMDVVIAVRPSVWRTITSSRPYRTYYLYMSPPGEIRLRQLESVYAFMFFLGSLTRYRPTYLLRVLDGRYGAFVREFLATQPRQFLFGLACEFRQQEVSQAAVV